MASIIKRIMDKKTEVVLFSSTAIALYGYDQGMMSLINTNYDYLATMGLAEDSPMVGLIVSVYYLGCAVGSVFASAKGAQAVMIVGRTVMGLGVGGIDSVVPVYSSELAEDDARGTALAQEFQANIFGLNMAFALNILVTNTLGKLNQWAWRTPIIVVQIYPFLLFAVIQRLPETPRWFLSHDRKDDAQAALEDVFGEEEAKQKLEDLITAQEEESSLRVHYRDMLIPGRKQFHPTVITIMGQVNQALTGYGAVSVYGPQIFELLGFGVMFSQYLTLGNYIFYLFMMTLAWVLIDRVGRRWLMVTGAFGICICFAILNLLGGLAMDSEKLGIPLLPVSVPGIVILYIATATFGIGWLVPPWLVPTEIYPSTARAQGAAISVIVWGLANFAVTLLTPIGFNNLHYWLFLVFALTNLFAGWWSWACIPESGGRSFEENQEFFDNARDEKSWLVRKVSKGEFLHMPHVNEADGDVGEETRPLLSAS